MPGRGGVASQAGFTVTEALIVVSLLGLLMAAVFTVYHATQRSSFRASGAEAALVQARAVIDKFGGDFRMVGAARIAFSAPISTATSSSITFQGDIDNTLASDNNPVTVTTANTCSDGIVGVCTNAASMTVSDAGNITCGTSITLADGAVAETHTLPSTGCKSGTTITFGTETCPTSSGGAGDRPCTPYPTGSFVYTVESVNWVWDQATGKLCRKVNTTCPGSASSWNDDSDVIASGVTNFSLSYQDRTGATLAMSGGALPSTSFLDVRGVTVSITVRSTAGEQTITRTMDLTARARNVVP